MMKGYSFVPLFFASFADSPSDLSLSLSKNLEKQTLEHELIGHLTLFTLMVGDIHGICGS